jgi:DNA segregation ATPase FtsK/SpoIIIE-like protein
MSLQDLVLICRGQRSRHRSGKGLAARAWRGLSRAFERAEPPAIDRREPTLDLPPRAMTVGSQRAFHVSPGFDYEADLTPRTDRNAPTRSRRVEPRRRLRDPEPEPEPSEELELSTDERAMAKRFAPDRSEPAAGFGLFRRRGTGQARASAPQTGRRTVAPRPIWPGSVPVPADEEMPAAEHDLRPVADELYGRAVALVRAQRKASTAYLQQSLGIGYMRAADLIERMEREGVVGAPVHNGIRPILTPPPGTRIV